MSRWLMYTYFILNENRKYFKVFSFVYCYRRLRTCINHKRKDASLKLLFRARLSSFYLQVHSWTCLTWVLDTLMCFINRRLIGWSHGMVQLYRLREAHYELWMCRKTSRQICIACDVSWDVPALLRKIWWLGHLNSIFATYLNYEVFSLSGWTQFESLHHCFILSTILSTLFLSPYPFFLQHGAFRFGHWYYQQA